MQQHPLIEYIEKYVPLTADEEHIILNYIQIVPPIAKKAMFLKEGQTAKYMAFVLSGCLRSYSVDDSGMEHVLQFAPQGWWITDMNSMLRNEPSLLNIDALLESEVLLLSREHQLALFDEVPVFERYFRIITEFALSATRQRVMDNMNYQAKDRYLQFCNTYPGIMNAIPQKYIASYLGVTPEFLSKLRSQL